MKIIIYTINNCAFCKQEKEYLTSKNLPFEERNLEANREFLAEMLKLSNNFAGVPYTTIEKDNGEKVSLKGFTQEEFETALNASAAPASVVEPVAPPVVEPVVAPVVPPVAEPSPVVEPPKVEVPPVVEPVAPPVEAPAPVVEPVAPPVAEPVVAPVVPPVAMPTEPTIPQPPTTPPPVSDELKKVIESLDAMTGTETAAPQQPVAPAVEPVPPVVPLTVPTGMPSIPDFPANK